MLSIRDVELEFKGCDKKVCKWEGNVPLREDMSEVGYVRVTHKKGGGATAWASFGEYKPTLFPIAGDTQTIRLADGLGLLKAPEATPDTAVSFVVTPPFVFGQGELIPRSFAYSFKVISGNLGNNAQLELFFAYPAIAGR